MRSRARKLEAAFEQGVDARDKGETLSENPYCPGTPERDEWTAGWQATPDLDEEDDPESSRIRSTEG